MSNKTSDDNVANIEIIKNFIFELKSFGLNKDTLEVANELENLLSDYTRQKQINEEHKKINGELRKKVKELEEENLIQRKQIMSIFDRGYISKQVVKEGLEDIEDYFDRLNGPDEDIEYIKQIKQELLGGKK